MATFGGFDRWREEAHETRLSHHVEILGHDLKLAIRGLRHSPSYTVPALATIALGVAALATIITLAYDVLLRPLPYAESSRLVAVYERNVPRKGDRNVVSAVAFLAWRQRSRTMDSVSAIMPDTRVWTTDAGAERVSGALVSTSFFAVLGVHPAIGAGFSGAPNAREVVVSHAFWSRRPHADPSIVGKTIRMDGAPVTLVGVMPPSFEPVRFSWLGDQEYWAPLTIGPQQFQWGRFLVVVARLHPGATVAGAEREAHAIHAQLRGEGAIAEGWDTQVFPLGEEIIGSVRGPLYALIVACGLLLVMVLTNTSLLTVAQARRRTAEYALTVRPRCNARAAARRARNADAGTRGGRRGDRPPHHHVDDPRTHPISSVRRPAPRDGSLWEYGVHRRARRRGAHGDRPHSRAVDRRALDGRDGLVRRQSSDEKRAYRLGRRRRDRRGGRADTVRGTDAAELRPILESGYRLRSKESYRVPCRVRRAGNGQRHRAGRRAGVDASTPCDSRRLAAARRRGARSTPEAPQRRSLRLASAIATARHSRRPTYAGWTPNISAHWESLSKRGVSSRPPTIPRHRSVVVNETFARKLWPGERAIVGKRFDLRVGVKAPEVIGVVGDARLQSPRREPRPTGACSPVK